MLATLSLFSLSVILLFGGFSILSYVLKSYSLYTMAKKRGLSYPALAWIPIVNNWIIGSLADQFDFVTKNAKKSSRIVLVILGSIATVIYVAVIVLTVVTEIGMNNYNNSPPAKPYYEYNQNYDQEYDEDEFFGEDGNGEADLYSYFGDEYNNYDVPSKEYSYSPVSALYGMGIVLLLNLLLVAASMTYKVFYLIAFYKIFKSADPDQSSLFLVLSILFSIEAFFLFEVKDGYEGFIRKPYNPYSQPPIQPVNAYNPYPQQYAPVGWNSPQQQYNGQAAQPGVNAKAPDSVGMQNSVTEQVSDTKVNEQTQVDNIESEGQANEENNSESLNQTTHTKQDDSETVDTQSQDNSESNDIN